MKYRNLLRFRLRTFLALIAAVSVWLAMHVTSTRHQKEAVQAIQEYGGWIRYDFQYPSGQYSHTDFDANAKSWVPSWALDRLGFDCFHDVVHVSLNYSEDSGKREDNSNPSDDALQHLPTFSNLRTLLLSETQATDSSMLHLEQLTNLEYLFMWDVAKVSDRGTTHLRPLKNLKYIHLSTSQITDKSLEVFGELPKLEGLSLQFNSFSDEGLQHLDKLRHLQILWVCGPENGTNDITDQGLNNLAERHNLTSLGVQHTKVTDHGLARFSEKLPNCMIEK